MDDLLGSLGADEEDLLLPDGCGFSAGELATAVKVLQALNDKPELLEDDALKELRRAGQLFVLRAGKTYFKGKGIAEYAQDRFRRKAAATRRQRAKQLDAAFVNNTQLRANRIEALSRLALADAPATPLLEGSPVVPAIAAAPAEPSAGGAPVDGDRDGGGGGGDGGGVVSVNAQGERELQYELRSCYICKVRFTRLHHFYDRLCPGCAALNYEKRMQSADLRGRIALVTGARVKIGFHVTLKLLRAGAHVIATTRFPHDAALRFAREPDFDEFRGRLDVYGIDFRDLQSVCRFADFVAGRYTHLDALVNNAAQTVRRPPSFYRHLIPAEAVPASSLPEGLRGTLAGQHEFVALSHGATHLLRVTEGPLPRPDEPGGGPQASPGEAASGPVASVGAGRARRGPA
eukprot:tig00020830_g14492.t1